MTGHSELPPTGLATFRRLALSAHRRRFVWAGSCTRFLMLFICSSDGGKRNFKQSVAQLPLWLRIQVLKNIIQRHVGRIPMQTAVNDLRELFAARNVFPRGDVFQV